MIRTAESVAYVWKGLKKRRTAVFGLCLVVSIVAIALLASIISPYDPREMVFRGLQPPDWQNLLGTDKFGRDQLSRIIWGAQTSLLIGLGAAIIATVVGTMAGAIAGYYGGITDFVVMRISDAFLTIPAFFLYLLVVAAFNERSPRLIIAMLGLTLWPSLCKVVRGEFLSLRERDYVRAAKGLGAGDGRIVFRHILPNALASIICVTTFNIPVAILDSAALHFLGLGDPTLIEWGSILSAGRNYLVIAPWIMVFPGIALFLTAVGFNLLGDGLRDALDPRLRGGRGG